VLGVVANVAQRVPMGFAIPGDQVFLLGETKEELGGSEWAHVAHQHLGGAPPSVDLSGEQRLAGLMGVAAQSGHLTAAHDLSDGGLSQALVEACLRRNVGVRITLPAEHGPFVQLFAESTGRVLVSVRQGQERAFVALANERGVPCTALGQVQPTPTLIIEGLFEVPLDELRAVHTATLPALFS
jgi:phosphoribosylformylglycinamidine synthase